MAKLAQKLNLGAAIGPRPLICSQEFLEPVHHRGFAIRLPIKLNVRFGHNLFTNHFITILICSASRSLNEWVTIRAVVAAHISARNS
jgi:hypothetical protein